MQEQEKGIITIEGERRFSLTGVERVEKFSSEEIRLVCGGKKMLFTGTDFKILSFSEGSGNFSASGSVLQLRVGSGKKKGIFA